MNYGGENDGEEEHTGGGSAKELFLVYCLVISWHGPLSYFPSL